MKKFDERSLEEKLSIITEDDNLIDERRWNEGIKIKFLVSAPIISFILCGFILYSETDFLGFLQVILFSFFFILFGVYLYSIMMR
tara:strand:- start:345 stop:599 length:255 start_codon:yes stop_codon:yes gene_type:complete